MGIAKSMVLAAALLMSTSAEATAIWHTTTIKVIYPYAGGIRFVLAFETEHPNCTNTQTPRKYYYVHAGVNGITVDDVKAFYALSMFAMAQEKSVMVLFDNATNQCYVSAIKLGE